ncbi:hypothetical protein PV08_09917 [Exophiala spinifera]|uniref:Xylanolytic transcriptional activator regulatory domain-containing protein n=1 Tax=Exophiala spinifera TaxID=91928 RepID=A0A0D2BND3_9EURO|nr:uncharacterized protein PV08_09917 [Exophiala spinifera]KIW12639.1 hypothetical protein PV08_09917 [Exophiala spinifera]
MVGRKTGGDPLKSYILELEARANADKPVMGRRGAEVHHQESIDDERVAIPGQAETPGACSSSSGWDADDIDDNPITEETTQLVNSPGGERQYLGVSSSLSLGLRFRDFIDTLRNSLDQGVEPDASSHRLMALPAAQHKLQRSSPDTVVLPPFAQAKRLFAAQYAYFGTTFFLCDQAKFEKSLNKTYHGELDLMCQKDCLDYCQVLIILAFGQLYSINQWTSNDGPPGFEYFQRAITLLPDLHAQGSTTFVEVLALAAWFFQNLNRRDAAFLYIGLALRMAITLGLHQEVKDPNCDPAAREYRRRLWWSVYSMDRILCIKLGNPPMVEDEDIGVFLPSCLGDEPETCSAVALRHYTQLSTILGKIAKTLYRRVHTPQHHNLVRTMRSILADLSKWDNNLPAHLRFDLSKTDHHQPISREAVSIYLHYSQCINMAARPLVFHVVRTRLQSQETVDSNTDWKAGLSPSTVTIVTACIAAARNTVTVMTRAAKQNLIATYGYQDTEHAFSAALILVMINIALPYQEYDRKFMWMALEVLEGMADKGSDHVAYLHSLLMSLCTAMRLGPEQKETCIDDTAPPRAHMQPPRPLSEVSAALPHFDSGSDLGDLQAVDDLMKGCENITVDPNFWWEGYGMLDINKI